MKELIEYREKLLARIREATGEFCDACRSFADPFANADGEWTTHQIAFHVRENDREVYGLRIRRTLNEDNPEFKNFDPEAWMAAHYNRDEPLESILNEFSASMNEVCDLLSVMPQAGWSRLSRHEALGNELTLQLWTERGLAHLEEHLAALKKAQNM
ncbi:MAG: hypothetical protein HYU84_14935 [Chloroflexi bacterium]|nr:hypothetical protein [Chloroflexota bacterium]MBI3170299.1 hypothetical protein [Chloroflexota bacterium]